MNRIMIFINEMIPNTSKPEMHAEKNFCEEKEKSSIIMDDMLNRDETCTKSEGLFKFKTEVKWFNTILIIFLHMSMLYACFNVEWCKDLRTNIWMYIVGVIGGIGVTAGAHRLWTHRAYKAKWPLRIILLVCYISAGQNNLFDWVRDHRVHHKYTDTDADPHNSNRGFFFSHVGWLMMKKHPDVIRKGRQIDMSDILVDPVAMFGYKYFPILCFIFAFLLPIMVPVYGWNETWSRALMALIIRYVLILNSTWCVNSVAHIWGSKPYDASISPTNNKYVAFVTVGEGWHNYHHVFPWDYKAAELGNYSLNFTTMFIDFCAKIGWAYELKQPSEELIRTVEMKNDYSLRRSVSYPSRKID